LERYGQKQIDVLATLEKLTAKMQSYSSIAQTMATRNTGSISSDNTYTVKKGDTLSGIADYFGITLEKLKAVNSNIKTIKAGQKIKIPTYSTGGVDTTGGLAVLHGTPSSIETIFNATDGKKLYDFIHNTPNITTAMINKIVSNIPSSSLSQVTNNSSSPNIKMEINIEGNADSDTVNQLKKSIPELVYKAINKANTGTTTSIWRQ
jgi:LysM repeat protein